MIASTVSSYLVLQLLLIIGGAVAFLVRGWGRHADQLRLNYTLLCLVLAAFSAHFSLPDNPVFEPAVRLWAASAPVQIKRPEATAFITKPRALPPSNNPLFEYGLLFIIGLTGGAVAMGLSLSLRDAVRLWRLSRRGFTLRQVGRVRILVSEEITVPFSYRSLLRANVVLPIALLAQPESFRLSVQHELQHHRQGDTAWAYIIFVLKSVSFWNPLVHAWMARIGELQELACDEALVHQKRADPQAYARCLIEAAQTALATSQPVCATGLLFGSRRQFLSRRINSMFEDNKKSCRRLSLVAGTAAALLLGAAAYAAKGMVQDRRISLAQAQDWARAAQLTTSFPVVVNEEVVHQLNRYLGTQDGREFIRNSLRRMQDHREVVEQKIRTYGMPEELMAVPIIESGYQNLPQGEQGNGAGLWQFIASTARNFGLIPINGNDPRLDIPQETDAAMRYLGSNNLRFRDWQLALLAYNQGERAIQECIDRTGSRNAWHLIENGCKGDRGYLAKFMAALLILKNPSLVN